MKIKPPNVWNFSFFMLFPLVFFLLTQKNFDNIKPNHNEENKQTKKNKVISMNLIEENKSNELLKINAMDNEFSQQAQLSQFNNQNNEQNHMQNVLVGCGEICDHTITGTTGIFFDYIEKNVDCRHCG